MKDVYIKSLDEKIDRKVIISSPFREEHSLKCVFSGWWRLEAVSDDGKTFEYFCRGCSARKRIERN
jgi:hypothetical protein